MGIQNHPKAFWEKTCRVDSFFWVSTVMLASKLICIAYIESRVLLFFSKWFLDRWQQLTLGFYINWSSRNGMHSPRFHHLGFLIKLSMPLFSERTLSSSCRHRDDNSWCIRPLWQQSRYVDSHPELLGKRHGKLRGNGNESLPSREQPPWEGDMLVSSKILVLPGTMSSLPCIPF